MVETESNGGPEYILSGEYAAGHAYYQNAGAYFWSSTATAREGYTYALIIYNSSFSPTGYITNSNGFTVRCIARD